ncbi:MAG: hypothetical protein GXP27_12395, partial [Planctomycetes bacterium]|nr:hypothetical protein [Planctomycetota bacterium]
AGAVDGRIDGRWGFHTALQDQPWWQVDLGKVKALDRVVLYNRCDRGVAARAARVQVLVSLDGKNFKRVYQHDGTVFYGYTDSKPLVVHLEGRTARFLRLQLPEKSYFHLDEVQVYATEAPEVNIALGRPATQSSTSQWSAPAKPLPDKLPARSIRARAGSTLPTEYPVERIIQQGVRLAASLRRMGVDVAEHESALRHVAQRWAELDLDKPADADTQRRLYLRARWTIRRLAMSNPLLDFDEILFVKRAPTLFPHMSDQYYGWWSRGGGGLYILSGFKGDRPQVRCLTEGWPEGNFLRPDLSYDGKRVLFAYCRYYPWVADVKDKTDKENLPEDAFYHIFEMKLDGTGVRQLTRGRYDDFDARYLPDGDIIFLSTRKSTALQVSRGAVAATCQATQRDSYVRCGGDNHRPVAVFTLHRMEPDGSRIRPISAFENFEWTPSVANDGRVLYARWDYIDRFNGPFISLWSMLPDGRAARLVYGNYTKRPQCVFEARPVPGSSTIMFTASAHHSINGGSVVLLDPRAGTEYDRPILRLTPQVCFPETEGWPASYYSGPWPLSEEHFLVAWSDRPLPGHHLFKKNDPANPRNASGIYLADAFGNLNLLYRDPDISCMNPIPIRPRPKPAQLPEAVAWDGPQEGTFLLQDVYRGLDGIARGRVKRLRIVAVPPKVQPHMNVPKLGVSREDPGKYVLGTVPVEPDGSAYFRVPSGVPVFFQALDERGLAVQTMRSLTYVQPGETLTCVGCHEPRGQAPPNRTPPMALYREPSRITLGPDGSWPLDYQTLVQPVLDRHCVRCHRPGASGAAFDLTPEKSYESLLKYADGDLKKLVFERDISVPGTCPAANSKLLRFLTQPEGHEGVRLDEDSFKRLVTWMDTYAQRTGSFSPEQAEQLRRLREQWRDLLTPPPRERDDEL